MIKIADQQFIKGFLSIVASLRNGIASDLSEFFGQEFQWKLCDLKVKTPSQFAALLTQPAILMSFQSQMDFSGEFHLLFDTGEFIYLSCLMQALGGENMSEKMDSGDITEDDMDAFREMANQLSGCCNNVLRGQLTGKIHIGMLGAHLLETGNRFLQVFQSNADRKHLFIRMELQMEGRPVPCESYFVIPAEMAIEWVESHGKKDESHTRIKTPAGKRIIIAYGLQSIRLKLKYFLEKSNFEVISCMSTREIIHKLGDEKIDLLLLDAVLQRQSAIEICKKLRTMYSSRDLPIVICSTINSPGLIIEALKAGATDYLIIPFPADDLIKKISKHL